MSLFIRLMLAALLVFAADALLFRTGWYARMMEPDSSAANVERLINVERRKQRQPARFHVVSLGDSRMGFFARFGNERYGAAGFRFGALSLGGTAPRSWYYMLRGADPDANRYAAIIIPMNDYDDDEVTEVVAERLSDLHYLSGQLRLTDLVEFAGSYPHWTSRWQAVRAILLKGFAYKRDVQAFLEQPRARISKLDLYKDWAHWVYEYRGEARSMVGLELDRKNKTAKYPEGISAEMRGIIQQVLLSGAEPYRGTMAAYRRKWLGRIVERYHGSRTRLIFMRLPRAPIPPDDHAPNPDSSIRQFARQPHVTLVDEHFFDSLERPELFMDPLHLNGPGIERFSIMVADEVRRILSGA